MQLGLTEIFQRSLLLILLERLSMHEVIEANTILEKIVDTSHDTEHSEGEDPDTDDSNNRSLTTNEPPEESEHSCENIYKQNGASQLPRRNRRPERTIGTGNEDQPVFSQRYPRKPPHQGHRSFERYHRRDHERSW